MTLEILTPHSMYKKIKWQAQDVAPRMKIEHTRWTVFGGKKATFDEMCIGETNFFEVLNILFLDEKQDDTFILLNFIIHNTNHFKRIDLCFHSLVDLVDFLNLFMVDNGEIVRISLKFYSGVSGWISGHELLIEL